MRLCTINSTLTDNPSSPGVRSLFFNSISNIYYKCDMPLNISKPNLAIVCALSFHFYPQLNNCMLHIVYAILLKKLVAKRQTVIVSKF